MNDMKQNDMNQYVKEWFEKNEERVYQLMREMWEKPELSLQEYHACEIMEQFAREEGFTEIQTHAGQGSFWHCARRLWAIRYDSLTAPFSLFSLQQKSPSIFRSESCFR